MPPYLLARQVQPPSVLALFGDIVFTSRKVQLPGDIEEECALDWIYVRSLRFSTSSMRTYTYITGLFSCLYQLKNHLRIGSCIRETNPLFRCTKHVPA